MCVLTLLIHQEQIVYLVFHPAEHAQLFLFAQAVLLIVIFLLGIRVVSQNALLLISETWVPKNANYALILVTIAQEILLVAQVANLLIFFKIFNVF